MQVWRRPPSDALLTGRSVADLAFMAPREPASSRAFLTSKAQTLAAAAAFPVFSEAPRKNPPRWLRRSGQGVLLGAPEYVRRKVWARWDAKIVRLFNERMEAIAVHVRQEPGKFKTDPAHIHDHKNAPHRTGRSMDPGPLPLAGPGGGHLGRRSLSAARPESLRVLQGLLALAENIPPRSSTKPASWP